MTKKLFIVLVWPQKPFVILDVSLENEDVHHIVQYPHVSEFTSCFLSPSGVLSFFPLAAYSEIISIIKFE